MQPVQTSVMAAAPAPIAAPPSLTVQDRMVLSRLGVYTGLFYALRAKHPPTAAHAFRVAIGCSKWAQWRHMAEDERGVLEVAALLHDIGKIGIPDGILQKPSALEGNEWQIMQMQDDVAAEILRGAGAGDHLIKVVKSAKNFASPADSTSAGMLRIIDAFDSMTTDQVFRKALTRDSALEELFAYADEQFDRPLVEDFSKLVTEPRPDLESSVAQRWLSQLMPGESPGFWDSASPRSGHATQASLASIYTPRLLDVLTDAAIYLDAEGQVLQWNRAAEEMSGHQSSAIVNTRWDAATLGLTAADGEPLTQEQCPLHRLRATHTKIVERLRSTHMDGRQFVVDLQAIPVFSGTHSLSGIILLIRDASTQASLEQKVLSLHEISRRDPLTKVGNRADLDRRLPEFVEQHIAEQRRGSLIICDIDFFKRINDQHGHQAGDDALITFAGLLEEVARKEDYVARYGGEEFVILAAGCDTNSAVGRAEEMRKRVETTPVPALQGATMTSSFGVTEIQPGDDAETLLSRADRALLTAKESGRNRVVQLGAGQEPAKAGANPKLDSQAAGAGWAGWFRGAGAKLLSAEYLAAVPKEVALQKLKGFIADHKAELLSIKDSRIAIRVDAQKSDVIRRTGERSAVMLMDVEIQTVQVCTTSRNQKSYQNRTRFKVSVQPVRARDRRSAALQGQAQRLLRSFQAYLVAQEIDGELRRLIIEPR